MTVFDWLAIAVVGVSLFFYLRDRWGADNPAPAAAARQAYLDGDIDESELERRLELAIDPAAEEIRSAVEPINGVGPATSAAIAAEFETLDDLEDADREALTEIHGVGPSTADAIRNRLSG